MLSSVATGQVRLICVLEITEAERLAGPTGALLPGVGVGVGVTVVVGGVGEGVEVPGNTVPVGVGPMGCPSTVRHGTRHFPVKVGLPPFLRSNSYPSKVQVVN